MGFDQNHFHVGNGCCLRFRYVGATQAGGFFSLRLVGKGSDGGGIGFYLHQSDQIGGRLFGGRFRFGIRSRLGGRQDVAQGVLQLM